MSCYLGCIKAALLEAQSFPRQLLSKRRNEGKSVIKLRRLRVQCLYVVTESICSCRTRNGISKGGGGVGVDKRPHHAFHKEHLQILVDV